VNAALIKARAFDIRTFGAQSGHFKVAIDGRQS
jgi:hypothetical protein